MPSSRPTTIPPVIHLIRQLKPKSILDVGVGFGKWGHLFREYTDILEAEHHPERYERRNWQVRIDGIEGHAPYITEMHRFLYNDIHMGDARELIARLPKYDVVFMGDVIEHFEKQQGLDFLTSACAHALKAVVVTTPKFSTEQEDLCGNELERHRSLWSAKDFEVFPRAIVHTIDRSMLIALLPNPGLQTIPSFSSKKSTAAHMREAQRFVKELAALIPFDEKFVLVDEEQVRSLLPHSDATPFLQREGTFWGAPPDDKSAIDELEQARKSGARSIVFVAPCFWWLEHYAGFARYLSEHFTCTVRNKKVVVYDLRKDIAA